MSCLRDWIALWLSLWLLVPACGERSLSIRPGRPHFEDSSPEGYWIWEDGGVWHLRTSTGFRLHRFHGWIEPIDGKVTELRPSRPEWMDRVHEGRRGIEFDFSTDGFEDGFDWRVSSGCNRFFLEVDGVPRPDLAHLGGSYTAPIKMPFGRCE